MYIYIQYLNNSIVFLELRFKDGIRVTIFYSFLTNYCTFLAVLLGATDLRHLGKTKQKNKLRHVC